MANSKAVGVAYSDPAIDGGTIENTPIGQTTPAAITGTTVIATTLTSTTFAMAGLAAASASTTVAALTLTTSLQSGFGWTTSAGHAAAVAAINSLISCVKDKGLMAT